MTAAAIVVLCLALALALGVSVFVFNARRTRRELLEAAGTFTAMTAAAKDAGTAIGELGTAFGDMADAARKLPFAPPPSASSGLDLSIEKTPARSVTVTVEFGSTDDMMLAHAASNGTDVEVGGLPGWAVALVSRNDESSEYRLTPRDLERHARLDAIDDAIEAEPGVLRERLAAIEPGRLPLHGLLALLLTATACGPELADGLGYDSTDTSVACNPELEDCTTPVDSPSECVPPAAMVVECDQDTLCWTWSAGWSAWAQYAEPTGILAAIGTGILTPTDTLGLDAQCFDLIDADHHVCVVEVDCIGLLGRPAHEIGLIESECASKGPWDSVGETPDPFGICWGVVKGVAVMLDPEH